MNGHWEYSELPALIRRQLPTTEAEDRQRRGGWEKVWRREGVRHCNRNK